MKKHLFLSLFVERGAKSSKNGVFRIYCELCTKCLEKPEKKTDFSHFLRNVVQKAQTRQFFYFFTNFVQSVSKNVKKTLFSQTFLWNVARKAQKTLFFGFIAKYVQSVSKNLKKTLISHTFWETSRKKF